MTSRVRVVYVEDDPIDQELFRHSFRHFRDQITIVSSGEELERRWHELQPTLIFVDATILGDRPTDHPLQGPKIVEHIRRVTANSKFPAILITGSDSDTAESLARQCQADGFTTKPVKLEHLFDELSKAGFGVEIVHNEIVVKDVAAS